MLQNKMEIKLTTLCMMYMVWCGVVSSHARPASLAAGKCQIDEDCPDGKFCFRFGDCVSCRNCSKMGRLPPRDSNCARTKDECGPCRPGYRDTGAFCAATTTTEETPLVKPLDSTLQPTNNTEAQSGSSVVISSTALTWVIVIIVFMIPCLICLTFYGRSKKSRSSGCVEPQGPLPEFRKSKRAAGNSENVSLTSDPLCDGLLSEDYGASAPLEEEYRQLPYNYGAFPENGHSLALRPTISSRDAVARHRTESRKQRALPFDAGNGSGNWAVAHPVELHQPNVPVHHDILHNPPPLPEQPNDIEMQGNINQVGVIPALPEEEVAMNLQDNAVDAPNVGGAEGAEIPNFDGAQGFFMQLNFRAVLRFFRNDRQETNVQVGSAPRWMEESQVDVMHPRTNSNSRTSLDSGISSSAGENQVPSMENSFLAPVDCDMVLEEDVQ